MTVLPLFSHPIDRVDTDERFTPAWVFDALGEVFDLDPASPVEHETHVPAATLYTRVDDGLAQPWRGFVWLNPPFSNATPWADRFIEHADGLWLGPVANSGWFQRMLRTSDLAWLMKDFPFDHPLHAGKRSSMPLAMFGWMHLSTPALAVLTWRASSRPARLKLRPTRATPSDGAR